jgi:hypothetical protein
MSPGLQPFVQQFLSLLPFVLVWGAGIVLALVTWKRHPQASALAAAGFAVFLVEAVIGAVLTTVIMRPQDVNFETRMRVLNLVGYARSAVRLVGWGLLLAALFLRRPRSGRRDEEDYDEDIPETGIRRGRGR